MSKPDILIAYDLGLTFEGWSKDRTPATGMWARIRGPNEYTCKAFMRGDGYARVKPNSDPAAPKQYVGEMDLYSARLGARPRRALRILSVPIRRGPKTTYTDRILIHPATDPSQLKGCIAPVPNAPRKTSEQELEALFEALGGWRVGKQVSIEVVQFQIVSPWSP